MKWITHQSVAVGVAYICGLPPLALTGAFIGSVLPDVLDQWISRFLILKKNAFYDVHRGTTHWFGWWLCLMVGGMIYGTSFEQADAVTIVAIGIGFGGITHIGLDMCTVMGVPIVPWSRKHMVSLGLCSTGSLREYAFLTLCMAGFAFFAREDVFKVVTHVKKQLF